MIGETFPRSLVEKSANTKKLPNWVSGLTLNLYLFPKLIKSCVNYMNRGDTLRLPRSRELFYPTPLSCSQGDESRQELVLLKFYLI